MEGVSQKTSIKFIAVLISVGLFFIISIHFITDKLNQLSTSDSSLPMILISEKIIHVLFLTLFLLFVTCGLFLRRLKNNQYVFLFPLIILVISLLGTLTTWYVTQKNLSNKNLVRFEIETATTNTSPVYGFSTIGEYLPTLVLIAGTILSLLVSGMVYFLVFSRQRALSLAAKMTSKLANKKNELAEYINQMSTFNSKLDPNGNFILCSRSLSEASGIPLEAILQYNFTNSPWWAYNAKVQATITLALKKTIATKKPVIFIEPAKFKDKIIYLNTSLLPVLNETGDIRYIIAEERDVTDLKTNEEQLKKRTYDLERTTRNMVGRELKMIEIKNKLKRLGQTAVKKK